MNFRPLAYKYLTFNTPLSDAHADALARRCSPATNILDLGCGWGELLLRLVTANPGSVGVGIDNDPALVARATGLAGERELGSRVTFEAADAKNVEGTYDLVVSIGATHIWGSDAEALAFLREHLVSGGKLLFGTGIYMKPPSPGIKDIFGELPTYDELQTIVGDAGFTIVSTDLASLEEWDDFTSTWRRGLEESTDKDMQALARERKAEYEDEEGYRGVLGLCYVVAQRAAA